MVFRMSSARYSPTRRSVVWGLIVGLMAFGAQPARALESGPIPGETTRSVTSETRQQVQPNTITSYGPAHQDAGPSVSINSNAALASIAATPDGDGMWISSTDGGVFSYGNAPFFGSMGATHLNAPIAGMAATPSGDGYWLVASDGGIFSFGDARFFGSMGSARLNKPVVAMAATPSGRGYWLVASDGGIFSFGDAAFFGSLGGSPINAPVVDIASTFGNGYWLATSDGGIFTFGDAAFLGSSGDLDLESPAVSIAAAPGGDGYWIAYSDGQTTAFGVTDHGSADGDTGFSQPTTVAIEASPDGGYWLLHGSRPVSNVQDVGPRVVALQQRLTNLGYWLGPIDGKYGSLTRQAVYAFDKVEGLPVDGAVDAASAARLAVARRPIPNSKEGSVTEVDKTRQVVFVVRNGLTVWTFNTSTGTELPYTYQGVQYLADTPPGHFSVAWQVDAVHVSHLGRLYRPKFFHPDGIAIHGYSEVPDKPASHGCVRVTNDAMDFIWSNDLVALHSSVWVYGTSPT